MVYWFLGYHGRKLISFVTSESLHGDLNVVSLSTSRSFSIHQLNILSHSQVEVLLALSVTLLGFSLAPDHESRARSISKWTSSLALWLCLFSWGMTRRMVNQIAHVPRDTENLASVDGMYYYGWWQVLLGIHVPRTLAVLCLAIATCTVVIAS